MASHPLWKKEEQTEGKHLVLEYYLDGWFQILGSSHNRILYIDGFAGPGEYSDGEPGSPLIALECIRKHKTQHRLRHVEIICLFMESDIKHANHLKMILKEQKVNPNVGVHVHVGKFDNHMTEILDYLEEQKQSLAPSFVMSDETIYHSGQLRKNTLMPLEKEGRKTVIRPNNNRGFLAGKGITIRFH